MVLWPIRARVLFELFYKVLSKSTYRVRLNVNMDIADSISSYFKIGKGCQFVLRLKQHFFNIARFFSTNRVNRAIVD